MSFYSMSFYPPGTYFHVRSDNLNTNFFKYYVASCPDTVIEKASFLYLFGIFI